MDDPERLKSGIYCFFGGMFFHTSTLFSSTFFQLRGLFAAVTVLLVQFVLSRILGGEL